MDHIYPGSMSKLLFWPHPSPSLVSTRYPELVIKLAPQLAPLVRLRKFTFKLQKNTLVTGYL